jgi:hypothetical protein
MVVSKIFAPIRLNLPRLSSISGNIFFISFDVPSNPAADARLNLTDGYLCLIVADRKVYLQIVHTGLYCHCKHTYRLDRYSKEDCSKHKHNDSNFAGLLA